MASKFVTLEEAAKLLGVPTDKLVQLRSDGNIRGFKDGASWKFNQDEIDRLLADGLGDDDDAYTGFGDSGDEEGSAILVNEQGLGSGSNIIGGDQLQASPEEDSDLELDLEKNKADSDLLVTDSAASSGSLDSFEESAAEKISLSLADDSLGELELGTSGHSPVDDDDVDLSIDLSLTGDSPSDGGDIDMSLADAALSDPNEINLSMPEPSTGGSDLDLDLEQDEDGSGLGDSAIYPPQISLDVDSDADEPMDDFGLMDDSDEDIDLSDTPAKSHVQRRSGNDVLSELDLLGAEQGGSGLIRGDSGDSLLGDADFESPLSNISDIDDALDNDDDLVISDDDDDLVLGSAGSDVSVMDDSGINLMSPSDSGLSLESEPLDLAGSSISALDLGSEGSGATPGSALGSGSRAGASSGSLVDFKADEEFQLSPSGIGLEADDDSASQVIEVEDSSAFGAVMDLGDAGFVDPTTGDGRGWAQRNELLADDAQGIDEGGLVSEAVVAEEVAPTQARASVAIPPGYDVPFSVWNVTSLAGILLMLSVGGMLSTDLIRNLWTYSETTSPISSLAETVLSALGMNG